MDEIPTFIINMRPAGLRLFGDQNEIIAFEDESIHQSWEEYDATLEALMKVNATLHPQVRARKPCSVFFLPVYRT